MKAILLPALLLLTPAVVYAQMGWTLAQCRKHFGKEYAVKENTYSFHVGPLGPKPTLNSGDGVEGVAVYGQWMSYYFPNDSSRRIDITFDPDGTVGKIQWAKFGKAFSESEIQQRLRQASKITWERTSDHESDELHWAGIQHGKIIFDANESDNGRGLWSLTITTR